MDERHGSERDEIRTLWLIAEKLEDAIEKSARMQTLALKKSTDEIVAAIQALIPIPGPEAVKATLTYTIGGTPMGNPVSGAPGQTATPTFTVTFSDGTTQPSTTAIYASDNTAAVTVDASGVATLVASGSANVSAIDQASGLTDTDAFTVVAAGPTPVSASLSYSLNPSRRR